MPGDARAGGTEQRGGGICKYFSNPRGKPRLPFPSRPSRASPSRLSNRRRSLLPFSRRFLLSIARFSRRFSLSPLSLFLPLSLLFSLVRRACEKKEEKKKERRRESVIVAPFLYRAPPYSPLRLRLPPFRTLSSRRVSGFAFWKEARWFSPRCYPLCIVHSECALNTSSRAGISEPTISRALEITSRLISGMSSSLSITKFR